MPWLIAATTRARRFAPARKQASLSYATKTGMTSKCKGGWSFPGKRAEDFVYVAADDVYICLGA